MENIKKIDVLGTMYTIEFMSVEENEILNNCDGYCDWTTQHIVVEREMHGNLENMDAYCAKVLRHELLHAFLFESGLAECTHDATAWGKNEEMVDWFARVGPKILKAWKEAGALDVQA